MCTQPIPPGGNGRVHRRHTALGRIPYGTLSRYAARGSAVPTNAPMPAHQPADAHDMPTILDNGFARWVGLWTTLR